MEREVDYHAAMQLLSYTTTVLLRMTSLEACVKFRDDSLDFVYIDGDHGFEMCYQDIVAWWYKVRKGGILAGHDFLCPNEDSGGWGQSVQPDVLTAATFLHIDEVFLVPEFGAPWSFYMVKK